MVNFAFVEPAPGGGNLPDPEIVRQTARDVLARSDYSLNAPGPPGLSFADLVIRFMRSVLRAIITAFEGLQAISPILAWLVILALAVSLILLLGHIVLVTVNTLKRRNDQRRLPGLLGQGRVDAAELARQAAEAASRTDYILGVRLLYRACLARLEQVDGKPIRLGATNSEHLKRFRSTPFYGELSQFVWTIDRKWYGYEPCVAADFGSCREAYEKVCFLTQRETDAQHP